MSDTNDMRREFLAWVAETDVATAWASWQTATARATALERERCAKLIETYPQWLGLVAKEQISTAIRQGGAECQDAIYVTFDDSDTSRKGWAPLPSKPRKEVV